MTKFLGLVAVTELSERLGVIERLDAAVGPIKTRDRGLSAGQVLVGMSAARQMTAPEAYISFSPEVFPGNGEVANESTRDFLKAYMAEFRDHVVRVLTILPRQP